MVDVIQKKRDGFPLTKEEIYFAIHGYTKGDIPDYQMSALAMAIYFKGMNREETSNLTMSMVETGDVVDLGDIEGIKVDKHSTGGVGDKTTLIVAPLVAAVGVPVAKMSGRGLGHTGGTVDKLESISGFKIELQSKEFIHNVNTIKLAVVGQSGNLVPADKMLYALRDVTATVNSNPLIASSIMSKKIASGADAIVLDVKFGSGAFMKTLAEAKELASTMVEIGNSLQRKTIAVLSNMDEPLGFEVGNANEVREAVEVLHGQGEKRLTELCLTLAAYMCVAAGRFPDFRQAYNEVSEVLYAKKALSAFASFIQAQGGDPQFIHQPALLPQAQNHLEVKSVKEGYVHRLHAEKVGLSAMLLGAGRKTKDDRIDYAAGLTLKKKVGDYVMKGETLAILHSNVEDTAQSEKMLLSAYEFTPSAPTLHNIVSEVMDF